MGKIDVKIRKGRYSPMFEVNIGIENKRFVSKQRFEELWEAAFQKECDKNKFSCSESEKNVAKTFDTIMFHACLKFVFDKKLTSIDDAKNLDT